MKKWLTVLILVFMFQTLSQADDSKDFEIEGMSLGDSALDYFSEEEIQNNKKYFYKNKKYFTFSKATKNNDFYERIQLSIKDNDKKYIIENLAGKILDRFK